MHFQNFVFLLENLIKQTNFDFNNLNYVSYTKTPGLVSCLYIGQVIAQCIAAFYDIPLIQCNHLHGHVYSLAINQNIKYPLLVLLASGGHTRIYYLKKPLEFKIIGQCLDDAAGEALDKIGRSLNLNYPAGPKIEELAKLSKFKDFNLINFESKTIQSLNFSFSGLKTQLSNFFIKNKTKYSCSQFCNYLQYVIIKILLIKLKKSLLLYKPNTIGIVGGVSANSVFKKELQKIALENKINYLFPLNGYATDNAAMIAILTYFQIKNKNFKIENLD